MLERLDQCSIGRSSAGSSYAAEPDVLIEQLRKDEAIAEADTLAYDSEPIRRCV
jgi:hypothetical protein